MLLPTGNYHVEQLNKFSFVVLSPLPGNYFIVLKFYENPQCLSLMISLKPLPWYI